MDQPLLLPAGISPYEIAEMIIDKLAGLPAPDQSIKQKTVYHPESYAGNRA